MSFKITQGTQTEIYSKTNAGTEIPIVKLDIGSGTATSDFGGTITEISNLAKGTVTALAKGTVSAGTIDAGTVSTVGIRHPDRFGTVVSSGTSVLGTIKPAVSGSQIIVTDLIISCGSATDVEIGDGGTANPLMGTLHFADDGGMVSNFVTPIETTAGSALVYKQSADVALSITAQGYVD